jgi:peptide deformylase
MAKLKIKKYGDPVLRKRAEAVLEIDEGIKKLASDMLETMYSVLGVGLAAPQVGVSIRLCVIDVDPQKKSPVVMVNPEIISAKNKIITEEGCLSFPGFYENINRFDKIIAGYTDLNGNRQETKAQNFLAKAVQHEIDHLDAKLLIDYLPDWKKKSIEKKIKRKKKAGNW